MNKILLVIKREFLSRVKKKSFLLATILVPLIFPAIMGGMVYLAIQNEKNKEQEVVHILDESGFIQFEESEKYAYKTVEGSLDEAKDNFVKSKDFAFIHIPKIDIENPKGIKFYAKNSPGIKLVAGFEKRIADKIRDIKLTRSGLTDEQLDKIKTRVSISSINLTDEGDEQKSDAKLIFGIGYLTGFLIYIFLFAYGSQVMQGVIEEKSSKVVEVIVSTIKPFHMMIGKVVGVASVGVFQFIIWIVLGTVLSVVGLSFFGFSMSPEEAMAIANPENKEIVKAAAKTEVQEMIQMISTLPILKIALLFLFYFIGGYFMYGALFAAVGSAVDNASDAQQFMMPIMMPIIIGLMGLFMFVFEDPHGTVSFWLSIIPFTSSIVMMGRVGFGVPTWEIILSMVLLIGGFLFTLWLAGRIYRVGILMHGSKVNYKVLWKWLKMKG